MKLSAWVAAIAGGLLLCACGRSSTDPPPPDLLKTQRDAMDKARATEKVVRDAAEKQAAQIESQQK
jgi:hypothetical protein